MNELIKVDFSGERPAVSARELHESWGWKPGLTTGFPGCVSMGFWRVRTFTHF